MSLPSDNPVLDARGLVFPADGSVLNQAALAVGEGETVAVLGAPGAGKSALKSCLCGESGVASGTVWTNGKPVHLLTSEQRRAFRLRHYGLVHQDTVFLPELTLVQSAALPLRFAGVGGREAGQRARAWLARFEIEDGADRRPAELAAPALETLRRTALVRAMVNEPLVLFADEPFAGLSDEGTDTLTRILRSIARSHGTAVIVFTSDADVAARCERVVHLVAGRTSAEPVPVATIDADAADRISGHGARRHVVEPCAGRAMSAGGSADTVDGYLQPRNTAWFRTRLAARLAVPLDRRAQAAALKVTWSAALAAPPLTIALIAPAQKLTLGTLSGLFCAGLPGFAATAWASVGLRQTRRLTARGLRQAGAEQRLAWLISVARLTLFATVGTLVGGLFVALSHAPLGTVLPRNSPLHGMFAAGAADWLLGIAMTIALIVGGALVAGSPAWERVDWTRLAVWRRINLPLGELLTTVRTALARFSSRT